MELKVQTIKNESIETFVAFDLPSVWATHHAGYESIKHSRLKPFNLFYSFANSLLEKIFVVTDNECKNMFRDQRPSIEKSFYHGQGRSI